MSPPAPPSHDDPRPSPREAVLRLVLFIACFALLQYGYGRAEGSALERVVIEELNVRPAAWLLNLFVPEIGAKAVGPSLLAPGGGINVRNGCEGIEVVFMLAAALLAAPLGWRARALGLLWGALLVGLLNQARVIALFVAYRENRLWFEWLHGVVTPLALVLAAGGFFLWWLARQHVTPAAPAEPAAAR
jgi:exosortase/archaeosortase family protein